MQRGEEGPALRTADPTPVWHPCVDPPPLGGRSAHTELHTWKTGPLCPLERHYASTSRPAQSRLIHQRLGS
jgi:hypothetical protein